MNTHTPRCLGFARVARSERDGLQRQVAVLRQFATDHGLSYAGEVLLDGVGGHRTQKDIDAVIQRKVQEDDFDVLLVESPDRLGRGSAATMIQTVQRLREAGITVEVLERRSHA